MPPCRYEAEQLPPTVTSQIDPRQYDAQRTDYVPAQDSEAMTAADCMPSMQWLQEFLADFAALRAQLHKYAMDSSNTGDATHGGTVMWHVDKACLVMMTVRM